METKIANVLDNATPALPTTFVSSEEGASLTRILELDIEQANRIAGGLASAIRCCASHCCSSHM